MAGISLIGLLVLAGMGIYVAAILGILAVSLGEAFSFIPLLPALGDISWSASTEFVLVAVPLFILMGEILLHTGIASDMFRALDRWVNWIPGGLMHTNIAASALFAATSGSSVATAATIGTVSIPNIKLRKYSPPLFLGSLAAGGTLGILIPPSINMIIYAVLTDTSVTDLYLAAMIPGALLAVMFSFAIFAACVIKPSLSGTREPATWDQRIKALKHLLPPILLFVIVVGSIYAGLATPTEAASLGVVASLIFGFARRRINGPVLLLAFEGTMRTTAMVSLIVVMAFFLNFVLQSIGVTEFINEFMDGLDLNPMLAMVAIIAFYLLLGMFMETLSLMIATTPIVVPVILALGFDQVWFGVLFMILIEAALITPPIGVNLFVVQAVRGEGPFRDVVLGSLPFLLMMVAMMFLLLMFPQMAMWLPEIFN
ncbi:MAG: TRAP transporter large permease [Alphaproteobacteria bacterium]|jgi:C4-dicarboxylate transporter, DctM subunit|nr:TRAP transporter large permease [Alphaproteobacteria bacterium]MBT4017514.1 TRAP transporter large permease [Alphaproteobacteria bacterium]MBT4964669.1 TRAP transporter large permease [Alphaproteobacteria bacterium]MBT5161120.1 TRAP transporter large permease [Alphaproteobacteria bacterium]